MKGICDMHVAACSRWNWHCAPDPPLPVPIEVPPAPAVIPMPPEPDAVAPVPAALPPAPPDADVGAASTATGSERVVPHAARATDAAMSSEPAAFVRTCMEACDDLTDNTWVNHSVRPARSRQGS